MNMNVFFILVLFITCVHCDCIPSPLVSSTSRSITSRSLTIYNNCGNDTAVYYGARSLEVPSHCMYGEYCTDFSHTNPAFWIARKGYPTLNFGARTLVEFNFMDPYSIWWDISLVKGFNYGVQIIAKEKDGRPASVHPETTCTNVNCKDAYWVCDTAWNNLFHPVYNTFGSEGIFDITFCPNATDTEPIHKHNRPRNVSGEPPFYCSCSNGITPQNQLVPPAGTVLQGDDCGSIS
jgi:hypothetical protein